MAGRVTQIPPTTYADPISCPTCGKVFAEWESVQGRAVVKKWCPRCKKYVYIERQG